MRMSSTSGAALVGAAAPGGRLDATAAEISTWRWTVDAIVRGQKAMRDLPDPPRQTSPLAANRAPAGFSWKQFLTRSHARPGA